MMYEMIGYSALKGNQKRMKISVDQRQIEVYVDSGVLLLEEILNSQQQEIFLMEAEKMNDSLGRDLWRVNESLKTMVRCRPIVNVVSQLLNEKLIRLCYDQYLPKIRSEYREWTDGTASLRSLSSYRGKSCAVLIPLSEQGNALFVNPDWKLELNEWIDVEIPHYLIYYTTLGAHFILNKQDPGSSRMNRLGYLNGDRLKEEINPIVHK